MANEINKFQFKDYLVFRKNQLILFFKFIKNKLKKFRI